MTAYIWKSEQTEPGCTRVTYTATADRSTPATIKPTAHHDARMGEATGLVYDESKYGDWQLVGKVNGTAYQSAYGDICIEMQTPANRGMHMTVEEVVGNRWYSAA